MRILAVTGIVIATLLFAQAGFGQDADDLRIMREEIKALKAGQTAIQKDLEEIKKVLLTRQAQPQAPAPFREASLAIENGYGKGGKQAKLVLMEFSEYQ
jgi:Tfp pilus assembly protein PilN